MPFSRSSRKRRAARYSLNRTMMEANAPVGGGVEEGAPEQRLPFRFGPVGKDSRGVENAFRPVDVQRLLGRSDGARASQGEGERKTFRSAACPSFGEHVPVGSVRVVLQLGPDVHLVLTCSRTETSLTPPDLDQLVQIQGAPGEGPSLAPGNLPRETRPRRPPRTAPRSE